MVTLTDAAILDRLLIIRTELAAIEAEMRDRVSPKPDDVPDVAPMAWGARVSPTFRARVDWICDTLEFEPNDLMSCIAWESGRSFRANIKNMAGSGATGLIQFMPSTARALGTTVEKLAAMTAEDQLNFVYQYFRPFKGRIHNLADVYMAILFPVAVGKPDDYVLFSGGIAYRQNAGLDSNKDARVTKAEAASKVYALRAEGLRPENVA